MTEAFICGAIQTPIGHYGGSLSAVCADDLGAVSLKVLMAHNPQINWSAIDDVTFGCANQTGGGNHSMMCVSSLLVGLPDNVPGLIINRSCDSGMDATSTATRATRSDEIALMIVGGVESMSCASFVMGKATSAFSRDTAIYDTTIDWRFISPLMKA